MYSACIHACTTNIIMVGVDTIKENHPYLITLQKRNTEAEADYNKYMLGVDKLDQMMSYYSFLCKTIKWWRKVFWILEVATVNAYILYKVLAEKRGERPMSHLAFRWQLILSLSEPIRSSVTPRGRPGPQASDSIERLHPVPHFLQKGTKRRDCVVCSDREEGGSRHLSLYMCGTCTDKPSLCPVGCFQAYHTQRQYQQ